MLLRPNSRALTLDGSPCEGALIRMTTPPESGPPPIPPPPPVPVSPGPPPPGPGLPPPGPGAPLVYGPPPPSPLWGMQPGTIPLATMPPVARVSKGLVLGLVYGGLATGFIILIVGLVLVGVADETAGTRMLVVAIAACAFGFLLLLGGWAAWMFLLHRAWSAIQDGQARTTPGKAVGFMFIPLFNIWWMFQAFPGFAQDFNRFRDRHRLPLEPLNELHFNLYCLFICLGNLPYVGVVSPIGVAIMIGLIGSAMADRINGIADLQAGLPAQLAPPVA